MVWEAQIALLYPELSSLPLTDSGFLSISQSCLQLLLLFLSLTLESFLLNAGFLSACAALAPETPGEPPQHPASSGGKAAMSSSTHRRSVSYSFHRMAFRNVFSTQQLLVQIGALSYASPYRILGVGLLSLLTGKETRFLTIFKCLFWLPLSQL